MAETRKIPTWGYEILREGNENVLRINLEEWPYAPSIEDNALAMALTIDRLIEVPSVHRIVFSQRKNYIYDYTQTQMLIEIASLYNRLVKQKRALSIGALGIPGILEADVPRRHGILQYIVFNLLRSDPIGAYAELKRILREENIRLKRLPEPQAQESQQLFINLLDSIRDLLEKTKLITLAKPHIEGYHIGDRSVYSLFFKPAITPDFFFTRLMAQLPTAGEQLDIYRVGNADVTLLRVPDDIKILYHLNPPEFKLTEDKYELLDLARTVVAEHQPKAEEFLEPEKMRQTFFNIGKDLITELAEQKNVELDYEEIEEMTNILVRYTVGFGLIEVLLEDQKVQDVVINGPVGVTPIFLVHEEHEECATNIIPSRTDAESWASKFRMLSGRPLDEANPVLDTELILPKARARIAIIQNPLNPFGLAYALRRHRDKPWTLPLFIQNRMISPLGAGLMSFFIDGARTLLIAGTRSSGKTSVLGAHLVDIMRKYRIITVEDSVTGDSEIIIHKDGRFERTTIGNLIDSLIDRYGCWYNLTDHEILGNDESIKVYGMNKEGKIVLSNVTKFIRHKINKPIYEITTKTGRKIKVTGDHSLFTLGEKGKIKEAKVQDLTTDDYVATPRVLPSNLKDRPSINILDHINKLKGYVKGRSVKEFIKNHKYEIKQLGIEHRHNRSLRAKWLREGLLPVKILKDMICLGYSPSDISDATFKISGNSKEISLKLELDETLLTLVGLWLADGCYDKKSVILSVAEKENQKVFYDFAKKCNLKINKHSDNFSLMINSSTLKTVFREVLELKGNAYTKRMPSWVFSLSKNQISYVLKGLFSGDGCVSDKEIILSLCSLGLLKDVQTLLLNFGIIFRIGTKKREKDKTYQSRISSLKSWKIFKDCINLLPDHKNKRLKPLCEKISTHDSTDVIPLSLEDKNILRKTLTNFNYRDYILRNNNIGRTKLGCILQETETETELTSNLKPLATSDIFWDKIESIQKIDTDGTYVYDISVPECESFVCENIIAHNTLELPTEALRKLGYNIQPMKVRSALMAGGTEVPADEGIRTSLRMGDSSLIVGEIRSTEAFALYEAMRIGALANVVAGTIHGDSPYGVFDRVVNDLKVPPTSFKATDIIMICNPIKSPDGMKKWRRVMSITEIRKHWSEDPLREQGFVDLMKYNSKTDQLEPTDDLINGESETLKSIGGNVKEWAGDWDAIWDNITLRAKIKETIVKYAEKTKDMGLLEAEFVVLANDQFHRVSETIKEEVGNLDSKRIFFEWDEWVKRKIRERKLP